MAKQSQAPKKEPQKSSEVVSKKKKISNPHDLFFRKVMQNTELVFEFIQKYIPQDVAKKVDLKSLQLIDGSFIDGFFHETRTDIIYRAKLNISSKKGSSQKKSYFYFLIEHQRKRGFLDIRFWRKLTNM